MKKLNRKEKGITLIALVVTIVVLLILAGISVSMLTGEDGLIKQSQKAKEETEKAEEKEKIGESVVVAVNKSAYGEITEKNLQEALDNSTKKGESNVKDNGDGSFLVQFKSGRNYEVDQKGTVTDAIVVNIGKINDNTRESETRDWGNDWKTLNEISKEISRTSNITKDTSEVSITVDGVAYTIGVGDTADVNITGTGEKELDKTYKVRILGFNHDILTSDSNKTAGISFEFLEGIPIMAEYEGDKLFPVTEKTDSTVITTKAGIMYRGATTGGWAVTPMRAGLNCETTLESLDMSKYIKQVQKRYIRTYNNNEDTSNIISNDYLWLLAASEICGIDSNGYAGNYYKAMTSEGERYKYYQSASSLSKTISYWLRSPDSSIFDRYLTIGGLENLNGCSWCELGDNQDVAVIPCFCI